MNNNHDARTGTGTDDNKNKGPFGEKHFNKIEK